MYIILYSIYYTSSNMYLILQHIIYLHIFAVSKILQFTYVIQLRRWTKLKHKHNHNHMWVLHKIKKKKKQWSVYAWPHHISRVEYSMLTIDHAFDLTIIIYDYWPYDGWWLVITANSNDYTNIWHIRIILVNGRVDKFRSGWW